MNQRSPIRTGNLELFALISAPQLDLPASVDELTRVLSSFNYREVVINLARINLLLQRNEQVLQRNEQAFDTERILRRAFCTRFLRGQIRSKNLTRGVIFNRQSTLRLLTKSACVSSPCSTRGLNTVAGMSELGICYLITNELLQKGYTDPETGLEEARKHILVTSILFQEYGISTQALSRIGDCLVRYKEFFRLLLNVSSIIDVNKIFSQATGLTLQEYQYLIFGILVDAVGELKLGG